jgi:hypothetical protein
MLRAINTANGSGTCTPGEVLDVVCCGAPAQPNTNPAPNVGQCSQGEVHATGCVPVDSLSAYATQICTQAGASLSGFTPDNVCNSAGLATNGTFTCCTK